MPTLAPEGLGGSRRALTVGRAALPVTACVRAGSWAMQWEGDGAL